MTDPNLTEEESGVKQLTDTTKVANEDKKHTGSNDLGSNNDSSDSNTPNHEQFNEKNDDEVEIEKQNEQPTGANESGNEDKKHPILNDPRSNNAPDHEQFNEKNDNEAETGKQNEQQTGANESGNEDKKRPILNDPKGNEQQTANSNEVKEHNGSNDSRSDDDSNNNGEFNSHSVRNSELTTTNTSETDYHQPTNTTIYETQHFVNEEVKTEIIPPANADIKNMKTKDIQQVNNRVTSDGLNVSYNGSKHVYEKKVNEQVNTNLYNNEDDSSKHDHTSNSTRRRPANQQLQTSKLLYIFIAFVILIPAYFYSQFKKPTFLQNVAEKADIITIGIGDIEVPDINIMNNHVVTVRKVANTIDRSPVFKSYGFQIAKGLREYGEKIRESGGLLRKMYSKGLSVHTSLEIEIEAMIQEVKRLNSRKLRYIQDEDARYFKERLDRLMTKIKDFRQSVEVAHNSILDAEEIKRNNEVAIENGFKEAKRFSDNEKYSIEISKASNELESVNNILPYLHTASGQLDKLKTNLKNYENSLRDVSEELDEENGVRFMMSDIRKLQDSIDNTKARQHKFNQISD